MEPYANNAPELYEIAYKSTVIPVSTARELKTLGDGF